MLSHDMQDAIYDSVIQHDPLLTSPYPRAIALPILHPHAMEHASEVM